jgi:hypothetical protein
LPSSDSDAPMVIGPVAVLLGAAAPLVVLELVQAASTLIPRTRAALLAILAFTPGSSLCAVRDSGNSGRVCPQDHFLLVIPADTA